MYMYMYGMPMPRVTHISCDLIACEGDFTLTTIHRGYWLGHAASPSILLVGFSQLPIRLTDVPLQVGLLLSLLLVVPQLVGLSLSNLLLQDPDFVLERH